MYDTVGDTDVMFLAARLPCLRKPGGREPGSGVGGPRGRPLGLPQNPA